MVIYVIIDSIYLISYGDLVKGIGLVSKYADLRFTALSVVFYFSCFGFFGKRKGNYIMVIKWTKKNMVGRGAV